MTLTNGELRAIRHLVREEILEGVPKIVEERLAHLPTKEECYSKMDEVVGEIKAIREEQNALTNRSREHED